MTEQPTDTTALPLYDANDGRKERTTNQAATSTDRWGPLNALWIDLGNGAKKKAGAR